MLLPPSPPSAIQQLILEYEYPVTCFINEEGSYELNGVVKSVSGKMVRPLRESWVREVGTREEWEGVRMVPGVRAGVVEE